MDCGPRVLKRCSNHPSASSQKPEPAGVSTYLGTLAAWQGLVRLDCEKCHGVELTDAGGLVLLA